MITSLPEFPPIIKTSSRKDSFIHSTPLHLPPVDKSVLRSHQHQRLLQCTNPQKLNIVSEDLLTLNDAITWFSKCNQHKQKAFLKKISSDFSLNDQRRLSTLLEPIFHRDYSQKLLHRYPSAGIKKFNSPSGKLINDKVDEVLATNTLPPKEDSIDDENSEQIISSDNVTATANTVYSSSEKSELKHRYGEIMEDIVQQLTSWAIEAAEYEVQFDIEDEYPPFSLRGPFVESKIKKEAEKQMVQLSSSGVFRDFTQYPAERARGRRFGHEESSSDEEYFAEGLSERLRKNKFKSTKESSGSNRMKLYDSQSCAIYKFFSSLSDTAKCNFIVQLIRISPLQVISYLGELLHTTVDENIGIMDLPDKIIYEIFCHLDLQNLLAVSQVCKRWYYLASLDQLWMKKCLDLGVKENLWNILNIIRRNGAKNIIDNDEINLIATIQSKSQSKPALQNQRKVSQSRKPSLAMSALSRKYSTLSSNFRAQSGPYSFNQSGKSSKRKPSISSLACRLAAPSLPSKRELLLLENPVLNQDGNLYRVDWKRAYIHLVRMVDRLAQERALISSSESEDEGKDVLVKQRMTRGQSQPTKMKLLSSKSEVSKPPTIEISQSSTSSIKKKSKRESIGSDEYIELEDYIDRRPLMKPILGRLKQFQEAEDVAVDFRPDLKFKKDRTEKFEAKDKLRYKHQLISKRERGKALRCIKPVEFCRKLTGHLDGILCMRFNQYRLFTGSLDQSIRMWDTCTGRSIHKFYGHKGGVLSIDFSEDIFISGSWDSTAMVWSLLPPKFDRIIVLTKHTDSVTSVRIAENRIFTGSHDKTICVYNKQENYAFENRFQFHSGVLGIECGEGVLLTNHTDKRLRLLTMSRGDVIRCFSGHEYPITSFIVSDHLIISGDKGGNILFWDRNKEQCEAYVITDIQCPIHSICYYRGNFWTGHGDGCVREWQLSSLTCVRNLMGHKGSVTAVQVTKDKLISCSQDASVRIWNFVRHLHSNPKPSDGYILPTNVKFETVPPK